MRNLLNDFAVCVRFLAGCCVFLLCSTTAMADKYGDVTVQYVPMYTATSSSTETTHGYVEHRFRVQNAAATGTKTVTVRLASDYAYAESGLRSATGSVEVPAGQTAQLVVFQPPVSMEGSSLNAAVFIDGRRQQNTMVLNVPGSHCQSISRPYYHYRGGSSGGTEPQVLVSIKTPTNFRDLLERGDAAAELAASSTASSSSSSEYSSSAMGMPLTPMGPVSRNIALWRSEADCDQWSENWLAYTRFDAVVLTDTEMIALPRAAWSGLRRYVECGGTLCVIGTTWTPPSEWSLADSASDFGYRAVLGRVFLTSSNIDSAKSDVAKIRKDVIMLDGDRWTAAMMNDSYGSAGFFSDPSRAANTLSVSHSKRVPIRVISILIIVFAVLIGPVNIYVLSIKNKRIWLLWTVPAISILASALVLGTNFFREGFVKYESSSTVTILDQKRGEALSFGVLGFYSTLTPREVVFSNDTEATVSVTRHNRMFELVNRPGGEQVFSGGWVQPRVPAYFGIRKAESRKERLLFQFTGEKPTVTNQLGTDIEKLVVCSPEGKYFTAGKVVAGDKVDLVPSSDASTPISRAEMMKNLSQTYWRFDGWPGVAQSLASSGTGKSLTPGSYVLQVNEQWNPFVEKVIEGSTGFENQTTIIGFFE